MASASPLPRQVSQTFDPARWRDVPGFGHLTDITVHRGVARHAPETHAGPGAAAAEEDLPVVRIAFNRPEVRNAFRPRTVDELIEVLTAVKQDPEIVTVLLAGNGPSPKDGRWAFSSGGDQTVRGDHGYEDPVKPGAGRLHILEVKQILRTMPKVVIAVVDGWAAGGGHSLHVIADLTIACAEHARFIQTDADVASFDAGYGAGLLARQVGQKRAREIFFLGAEYTAEQAVAWGGANAAVPHAGIEAEALEWADEIASKSPQAIRLLKFAFNLVDDGLAGQQLFAGEATRLAYATDEAREGRDAFLQRRAPDYRPFRRQIL
ncbi:MAG: 1,4-dihydroxy-2-naphthoyl-CoA synthase [Bifidobacteriaceae bacterium]|jgi:naphthoate synthase|nr:1,4-dihydroxy-2-naphthoyl-CoA synthase [Bifidobacteriaceae bacterium]